MAPVLNHTIVPSYDKDKAARFFAQVFDLKYDDIGSHFAAVKVNDTLTFDFANSSGFECHHYAFLVGDTEFEKIFSKLKELGIPYGSSYRDPENRQLNSMNGGRGLYFKDLNGHSLELMTRV